MAQVLDYSAGQPGAANIARAGFNGAVRYIGFPERRKCTTGGELVEFNRIGLSMALVFQDGTGDFLGGYSAGQQNARRARAHADDIGFPRNRPIYMAIDRDVVRDHDLDLAMAYLDGTSSVLGLANTGVYGEYDICRRALDFSTAHASYAWQTAAWSGGKHYAGAHLYQRVGTALVGGIACDINDVRARDWGQHDYVHTEDAVALTQDDLNAIRDAVWSKEVQLVQLDEHGERRPTTVNVPAFTVLAYSDARAQGCDVTTRAVGAEVLAAVQAGGLDAAEFAAQLAPLVAGMVTAGATPEQVHVACDDVIRAAFGRGAEMEGGSS